LGVFMEERPVTEMASLHHQADIRIKVMVCTHCSGCKRSSTEGKRAFGGAEVPRCPDDD
jgi:hypothetical protein